MELAVEEEKKRSFNYHDLLRAPLKENKIANLSNKFSLFLSFLSCNSKQSCWHNLVKLFLVLFSFLICKHVPFGEEQDPPRLVTLLFYKGQSISS